MCGTKYSMVWWLFVSSLFFSYLFSIEFNGEREQGKGQVVVFGERVDEEKDEKKKKKKEK